MPIETFFAHFKQSFEQDAITTKTVWLIGLSRYKFSKKTFQAMQKLIRPQPIALLKQGLQLLEQLNLVEMYKIIKVDSCMCLPV